MIKLFKKRIAENADIQKVVTQCTAELKAQRAYISKELGKRDQQITDLAAKNTRLEECIDALEKRQSAHEKTHKGFTDTMRYAIQHIFLYLPVKQSRGYRDYHNSRLTNNK